MPTIPMRANMVGPSWSMTRLQGIHRGLPFLRELLGPEKPVHIGYGFADRLQALAARQRNCRIEPTI